MANKPTILRAAGNNINQALNGAINSSTTTVILDDAGDCNASGGLLEIDYNSPTLREVIYYNSKSTHTLTVADDGRGLYGTTAQSHLDGALVRGFFVDDHINKLVDVVSNIEVSDLAADAVVTETDTITANDNDTTIPTSAAVKDYADTVSSRFKIGVIPAASFGSTGNLSITGVGFTPKLINFQVVPNASTGGTMFARGATDGTSQFASAMSSNTTPSVARWGATDKCIGFVFATSSTPVMDASIVSMDSDGFTINVTTANTSYQVAYEAFG